MSENQIKYLPPEVVEQARVQGMLAAHNSLKAVPDALYSIANLRVLDLSNN